ncbi:Bestrophin, RFP-TM, chloride channel-domain-containing protein [Schizophyllum amplum]|uniref:Bestrophin, RFP-TM, chloride channel-domain-containing protein n=1 Tax=Schizophyllum amplum TaxID=97359 RepID=A0A550CKM9_9AGAR|nr:Bestrophin, RFP-TM, chloride channel-domain-containing protein [Auriculariopsis ampla]
MRKAVKRSSTGRHALLPAHLPGSQVDLLPRAQSYNLLTWTFGRGSVIWRIWPAVLTHTVFAAAVVTTNLRTDVNLAIPKVLLTVLGVVIGFVISYRASTGYNCYWMGQTCWTEIIRNSRSQSRLIWFHVPLRMTPKTSDETDKAQTIRPEEELLQIMNEKHMALDLIEAFSRALKHHIRGELGIYYEDMYHLLKPFHEHSHNSAEDVVHWSEPLQLKPPRWITHNSHPPHCLESNKTEPEEMQGKSALGPALKPDSPSKPPDITDLNSGTSTRRDAASTLAPAPDPIIPPINAYGTFNPAQPAASLHPRKRRVLLRHQDSSASSTCATALLPSAKHERPTMWGQVSGDLIPFAASFWHARRWLSELLFKQNTFPLKREEEGGVQQHWSKPDIGGAKRRPRVAGGGENLPLDIVRCLSEWYTVLEERGSVPGTSMGNMVASLAQLEDNVSTLEKILTTPLPFAFSIHIRHTVWLYLFFLPFQLVDDFGWYTIPGVAVAAFIYLGFLAAGEEIEQPFGYDDNDLDLDLICREIIHADLDRLRRTPCLNTYFPPARPPSVSKDDDEETSDSEAESSGRSERSAETTPLI